MKTLTRKPPTKDGSAQTNLQTMIRTGVMTMENTTMDRSSERKKMIDGYSITITVHEDGTVEYGVNSFQCEEEALLAKLQEIVGGMIEVIPSADSVSMFVNEDGKNISLPRNDLAELFWQKFDRYDCMANGEWIAGNMAILGPKTPAGCTQSAPANTIDLIAAIACWPEEEK